MNLSLLYPNGEVIQAIPTEFKTIYNLSIDQAFANICPSLEKREYFFEVISKLTSDKNIIEYRREILKDFQLTDSLFTELYSVYERFNECKTSLKSNISPDTRMDFSYDSSLTSQKNILRIYSLAFKRSLYFVKKIKEILESRNITSKGLVDLLNECTIICEKSVFDGLVAICAKYENLSERGILDFKYTMTDNMRINSVELVDHRYVHITDPNLKKSKFSFFQHKPKQDFICQEIESERNNFYNALISGAFSDMALLLKSLTKQLFDIFLPIYEELDFYYVSLKYIKFLEGKGLVYCFPSIVEDDSVHVENLYDLFLVTQSDNIQKIVPNNYNLINGQRGIVVFGNNGSGKTVYLRAFGTMQLLVQSGLPVPCSNGKIKLYSKIISQYAEAEYENPDGNKLGRFETEVKELAEIIDSVNCKELILLNETFQSTSYTEGADGLCSVLEYFISTENTFVLVSHLRDLERLLEDKNIGILYTRGGYKIS